MKSKKLFICTLAISGALILSGFSFFIMSLYDYDYLQLYSLDTYSEEKFAKMPNMRLQARGIIEFADFDSVILGSSMFENSSALEASKLLGGRFINLSLSGSNFYERSIVLEYILRHKKIKNIIYSLDAFSFEPNYESVQVDSWNLLYDDNFFNDWYILYDKKYLSKVLRDTFSSREPSAHTYAHTKPVNLAFFDRPTEWMSNKKNSDRFGGMQNWVSNLQERGIGEFFLKALPNNLKEIAISKDVNPDDVTVEKTKQYIDTYVLRFVKENPSIIFNIIFPPYYRYKYAMWRKTAHGKNYFLYEKVIRYMVEKSDQYANLHVFGFDDEDFLNHIENYIDTEHYHDSVNSVITTSIKTQQHALTVQNVDAYLEKIEKYAMEFDLQKLYDDSQRILREQGKPTTWDEFIAPQQTAS